MKLVYENPEKKYTEIEYIFSVLNQCETNIELNKNVVHLNLLYEDNLCLVMHNTYIQIKSNNGLNLAKLLIK